MGPDLDPNHRDPLIRTPTKKTPNLWEHRSSSSLLRGGRSALPVAPQADRQWAQLTSLACPARFESKIGAVVKALPEVQKGDSMIGAYIGCVC